MFANSNMDDNLFFECLWMRIADWTGVLHEQVGSQEHKAKVWAIMCISWKPGCEHRDIIKLVTILKLSKQIIRGGCGADGVK